MEPIYALSALLFIKREPMKENSDVPHGPEEIPAWQRCLIGSCHRHQDCMYLPCRSPTRLQAMIPSVEIIDGDLPFPHRETYHHLPDLEIGQMVKITRHFSPGGGGVRTIAWYWGKKLGRKFRTRRVGRGQFLVKRIA